MSQPDLNEKQLSRLVLHGYKSIGECDLPLGKLNVLIGANGSGKSNFISFFRLMSRLLDEKLQLAVGNAGGPDALLHFGRKRTEELKAEIYFGENGYKFTLQPTQDNRLVFASESLWWKPHGDWPMGAWSFRITHRDGKRQLSRIPEFVNDFSGKNFIINYINKYVKI